MCTCTAGFMLYLGIQRKGSSQATLLSEETQGTAARQTQGEREGTRVWTVREPWFIAIFIPPQHSNTTLRKCPKHHCVVPISPLLSHCHGDQAPWFLPYLTLQPTAYCCANTSISVATNNLNISVNYHHHHHGYTITTAITSGTPPHLL